MCTSSMEGLLAYAQLTLSSLHSAGHPAKEMSLHTVGRLGFLTLINLNKTIPSTHAHRPA